VVTVVPYLMCPLQGKRGIVLVQLSASWDDNLRQPVFRPLCLSGEELRRVGDMSQMLGGGHVPTPGWVTYPTFINAGC
jgi:hypothetical protein